MGYLVRFENAVTGLILWVLFLDVGLQFFTRYVLNNSLGWTEEMARMLLILLTYSGAVICARRGKHIQVDLVFGALSEQMQIAVQRFYNLVSAALFFFLAYLAVRFAMQTRMEMSSIEIPKSILYWFCGGSLGLVATHYLLRALALPDKEQGRATQSHDL